MTPGVRTVCLVGAATIGSWIPLSAQDADTLAVLFGRVTQAETHEPVADAVVAVEGHASVTTDAHGLFYFGALPSGPHMVTVERLGFEAFAGLVDLAPPSISLRIRVSAEAIELDPVVVSIPTAAEQSRRGRGTARNTVTRSEIQSAQGTGSNMADVLARNITGVRIRGTSGTGGVCLEFRAARSGDGATGCHDPAVFMDGVRISQPQRIYASIPLEDIQSLEVIAPGEAGVAYGADSSYGVLLITTRTVEDVLGREEEDGPAVSSAPRLYDWSLEGQGYGWGRVFATAAAANAAGVLAGAAIGRSCFSFDDLTAHFLDSRCGSLPSAGSRLVMLGLPLLGSALGARWAGGTSLSHGRLAPTLVGAALMGVPGYLMVASGPEDIFRGTDWVGQAFLLVGMPAVATLADRLYRRIRAPSLNSSATRSIP